MTPPRWVNDPDAPAELVEAIAESRIEDRDDDGSAEQDYVGWMDGWWGE